MDERLRTSADTLAAATGTSPSEADAAIRAALAGPTAEQKRADRAAEEDRMLQHELFGGPPRNRHERRRLATLQRTRRRP
jgi:hypothetical protein